MDRKTACLQLGHEGELAVAELIRGRGHTVRLDGGNHLHDLVIEGTVTIEVKTALPSAGSNGNKRRWQFKLFEDRDGRQPMREDILILRCQRDVDGQVADHYIIPGHLVPDLLKRIDITSEPGTYNGKYSLFLDAWHLLDAEVALAVADGRQLPLPETIPF